MERAKTKNRLQRRWNFWGYLFILPNFIGFVLFFLIPLGQSIYYSFCQVTITEYGMMTDFVGLDNFYYAFRVASNYVDNLKESLINFVYGASPDEIETALVGGRTVRTRECAGRDAAFAEAAERAAARAWAKARETVL